jgi:uncharacterized C2H2 Zn-finger protein
MQFKCQKCKKIFSTEEECGEHSAKNKGHNRFDFKTIGVIKEVEG